MSGPTKNMLPTCGLYRTTSPSRDTKSSSKAICLCTSTTTPIPACRRCSRPITTLHKPVAFPRSWHRIPRPFVGRHRPDQGSARRASTSSGASSGSKAEHGPRVRSSARLHAQRRSRFCSSGQFAPSSTKTSLWFSDRGVGVPREQMSILDAVVIFQESGGEGDHGPANVH